MNATALQQALTVSDRRGFRAWARRWV